MRRSLLRRPDRSDDALVRKLAIVLTRGCGLDPTTSEAGKQDMRF